MAKSRSDECLLTDIPISAVDALMQSGDRLSFAISFSSSPDTPRSIRIDEEVALVKEKVASLQTCIALIFSGPPGKLAISVVDEIRASLIGVAHPNFVKFPMVPAQSFKGFTSSGLYFSMRRRQAPHETGKFGR